MLIHLSRVGEAHCNMPSKDCANEPRETGIKIRLVLSAAFLFRCTPSPASEMDGVQDKSCSYNPNSDPTVSQQIVRSVLHYCGDKKETNRIVLHYNGK